MHRFNSKAAGSSGESIQTAPLAVDINGAVALVNIGRTKILEASYSGELVSLKMGKRRLWRPEDLRTWLAIFAEHE
jgi:hypothetical protein